MLNDGGTAAHSAHAVCPTLSSSDCPASGGDSGTGRTQQLPAPSQEKGDEETRGSGITGIPFILSLCLFYLLYKFTEKRWLGVGRETGVFSSMSRTALDLQVHLEQKDSPGSR